MSVFFTFIIIVLYLLILVMAGHYLRTFAFKRHEAITYECSALAAWIALFLIWQKGLSLPTAVLFAAMLAMLCLNAYMQHHFYMELQPGIDKAFEKRFRPLKDDPKYLPVRQMLRPMASIAIMPSFSRSIEESRLLNNQAGFIGLLKTMMKRQRFQKKKYLMRDCFAETLNLLGPVRPVFGKDGSGAQDLPEACGNGPANPAGPAPAVRPEDFALSSRQETIGLLSFDLLGHGALLIIFFVMMHLGPGLISTGSPASSDPAHTSGMIISAILLTLLIRQMRQFAFARYESVLYELGFFALAFVSFRAVGTLLNSGSFSGPHWIIAGAFLLIFILLTLINKSADSTFRKHVNNVFWDLAGRISPETEINQTSRRFLRSLHSISDWALASAPEELIMTRAFDTAGGGASGQAASDNNAPRRSVRQLIRERKHMPAFTGALISMAFPGSGQKPVGEESFRPDKTITAVAFILLLILSIAAFAAVFLLMSRGII